MPARKVFALPTLLLLAALIAAGLAWQRSESAAAASAADITAGGFHTCALTSAGGVQCWGRNDYGQLGDGATTPQTAPVGVAGLPSGVVAVSAGGYHTCALTSTGGVMCWGRNDSGQLGDGTTTRRTTPLDVVGLGGGVAAISAGGFHTCAVTTAGSIKCWGKNSSGELGDGTSSNRTLPVDVVGLTSGVAAVAAGGGDNLGGHTCALTAADGVKCWGRNDYGQLGDGTTISRRTPADVVGLESGVASVRTGRYHTCALTIASGAKCWGWNIGGQLGDDTNTNRTTPVNVVGLSGIVAQLAAGGLHNCVVTTVGGVKCWGFNNSGQLGDGTTGTHRNSPVDVLEQPGGAPLANIAIVAAGGSVTTVGQTCALTTGGDVLCWGLNSSGQLGDGTTDNRTTPVGAIGFDPEPTPTSTTTTTATTTPTEVASPTPAATPTLTPTPSLALTPAPRSLEEQFDALQDAVDSLNGPPRGVKTALLAKLDAAARSAQRGQVCAAANALGAFVNQVEALAGHSISTADAASLSDAAETLVDELLSGSTCPHARA